MKGRWRDQWRIVRTVRTVRPDRPDPPIRPNEQQKRKRKKPKEKPYIKNYATPDRPPPAAVMLRLIREFFPNCSLNFRVLKLRFLAFSQGPGGFRELREADRNHFHLSWYLPVPGIMSYDRFSLNGPRQRGGYTSCRFVSWKIHWNFPKILGLNAA